MSKEKVIATSAKELHKIHENYSIGKLHRIHDDIWSEAFCEGINGKPLMIYNNLFEEEEYVLKNKLTRQDIEKDYKLINKAYFLESTKVIFECGWDNWEITVKEGK